MGSNTGSVDCEREPFQRCRTQRGGAKARLSLLLSHAWDGMLQFGPLFFSLSALHRIARGVMLNGMSARRVLAASECRMDETHLAACIIVDATNHETAPNLRPSSRPRSAFQTQHALAFSLILDHRPVTTSRPPIVCRHSDGRWYPSCIVSMMMDTGEDEEHQNRFLISRDWKGKHRPPFDR